ncbi:hypothetical protein [Halalkalibacter oceani]|uniref:hypothetical protein n=1 Tax=Halalkalibacter oceani TaxID=1653776 RepID=UPI0033952F69
MDLGNFVRVYNLKMKNNLSKGLRLNAIEEYFSEELGHDIDFKGDSDKCLSYIVETIRTDEENGEEILESLYNILTETFSNLDPNYIYELETDFTEENILDYLKRNFKKTNNFGPFDFILDGEISYDNVKQTISCRLSFEEFHIDLITNNRINSAQKGRINITFDLMRKKFISSNASYEKVHNSLYNLITASGKIILRKFYVLKRESAMKNRNFTDYSSITLLAIKLLYETIPSMGYNVTLESILFTNLNATKVQGMKMKGTDLLSAEEVVQRIHLGDKVQSMKITLEKIEKKQGREFLFQTQFTIDFRGKLAFIFLDQNLNEGKKLDICVSLYESIFALIYDDKTVEDASKLIQNKLPKPKSIDKIIKEIKNEVLDLLTKKEDLITVEKYFLEKYPTTFSADQ